MPRKKLIRTHEHVYHITTRSNSKEWFYLPSHEVWRICLNLLEKGSCEFKVEIHAFVLMSNHYHLMARFPKCDIDKFMQFFNREMSRRINQSAARLNHVFGRPYNWSIINSHAYYLSAIKYLYQNPLRAGICTQVEMYPYSTLNMKLNLKVLPFPITSYLDTINLDWLNEVYNPKTKNLIRKGLRRSLFRPGNPLEKCKKFL